MISLESYSFCRYGSSLKKLVLVIFCLLDNECNIYIYIYIHIYIYIYIYIYYIYIYIYICIDIYIYT